MRVIRLVGQERLTRFKNVGQQGIRSFPIVRLARRQRKTCRIAQRIATGMDFGGQPAF